MTPRTSKGQYINGQWHQSSGQPLQSLDPASGSLLWQGTMATEEDITMAWNSAQDATSLWAALSFEARCEKIKAFGQAVENKKNHLTYLIAEETGKPVWESLTEVNSVIAKIDLSIQAFKERTSTKQMFTQEVNAYLRYKPHGVVVVLGAFNFPAHISNGHIIPALLAGNAVLYKPSELTPAVAECIMECWHESGLPAGVIQCLQGDASCGKKILEQPIQGVYFTGSYATGLRIHQQFSNRPEVILALEMGGNNPLVVDEVSLIDAAIYHTLLSSFITAGQRCSCARRVMVPNSSFGDAFLKKLIQSAEKLQAASFDTTPEPFMGPVISASAALNHLKTQQQLSQMGGQALLSMTLLKENSGLLSAGIMDMTQVANPPDEELFAPFIQIYRYTHFDEAIQLANATQYGLTAGLLSDNATHYQHFYQQVKAGLINWNRPTTGASSMLPFGGVGRSGNHRPSAYFAADYCAYPIASLEQPRLSKPEQFLPGITLDDS